MTKRRTPEDVERIRREVRAAIAKPPSEPAAPSGIGFGKKAAEPKCGYCGDTGEVACSSTNYMPCPACSKQSGTKVTR